MAVIQRREVLALELRHMRDDVSTDRTKLKARLHTPPQQSRLERRFKKERALARDLRSELKLA